MYTQSGVSLIEILISLFIISIMLFGLDAMQLIALREVKAAYYVTVATEQITSMRERLIVARNKNITRQIVIWNKQNNEILPHGRGAVTGEYPYYEISIYWGNYLKQACSKNTVGQSGCLHSSLKI